MAYKKRFDNEFKPLRITEVTIWPATSRGNFLGIAHVNLDNAFVLKGIRLFKDSTGSSTQLDLLMPQRTGRSGGSHAMFQPTTTAAKTQLTRVIATTFQEWQSGG